MYFCRIEFCVPTVLNIMVFKSFVLFDDYIIYTPIMQIFQLPNLDYY